MYLYTKDNKAQLRMPAIINGRCMNGLTKKGIFVLYAFVAIQIEITIEGTVRDHHLDLGLTG